MQLERFRSVLINGWKSRSSAYQHSIRKVISESFLKVNKIVIRRYFAFGNSTCCMMKNKQTEMVLSGRGQDKAKLILTPGIPCYCCGVLKPQCEGKANASVSGRRGSVFLSGSRQIGVANYSPEGIDRVNHGDGLFTTGRDSSLCSIQCPP